MLVDPVAEALKLGPSAVPDSARRREDKARAYALADAAREATLVGALSRADALLAEAQRLAPDVGLVHQFRSNVAHLRGDRTAVIRALERAVALEPDNPLLQANLRAATSSR
jgi:predicted Zn-dependent protease